MAKKTYKLTVRATEKEYETIKLKAELLGVSMSRLMIDKAKNCYVDGFVEARDKKEERENKLKQLDGQICIE